MTGKCEQCGAMVTLKWRLPSVECRRCNLFMQKLRTEDYRHARSLVASWRKALATVIRLEADLEPDAMLRLFHVNGVYA